MKSGIWDEITYIGISDISAIIVQLIFVALLLPCKICQISNAVKSGKFNVFSCVNKAKIGISAILIFFIIVHIGFTILVYFDFFRIKNILKADHYQKEDGQWLFYFIMSLVHLCALGIGISECLYIAIREYRATLAHNSISIRIFWIISFLSSLIFLIFWIKCRIQDKEFLASIQFFLYLLISFLEVVLTLIITCLSIFCGESQIQHSEFFQIETKEYKRAISDVSSDISAKIIECKITDKSDNNIIFVMKCRVEQDSKFIEKTYQDFYEFDKSIENKYRSEIKTSQLHKFKLRKLSKKFFVQIPEVENLKNELNKYLVLMCKSRIQEFLYFLGFTDSKYSPPETPKDHLLKAEARIEMEENERVQAIEFMKELYIYQKLITLSISQKPASKSSELIINIVIKYKDEYAFTSEKFFSELYSFHKSLVNTMKDRNFPAFPISNMRRKIFALELKEVQGLKEYLTELFNDSYYFSSELTNFFDIPSDNVISKAYAHIYHFLNTMQKSQIHLKNTIMDMYGINLSAKVSDYIPSPNSLGNLNAIYVINLKIKIIYSEENEKYYESNVNKSIAEIDEISKFLSIRLKGSQDPNFPIFNINEYSNDIMENQQMKNNCLKLEIFLNKLIKIDPILGIYKFRVFFGVDDKWGREDNWRSSQHDQYFDELSSDRDRQSFENLYISPLSFKTDYFEK